MQSNAKSGQFFFYSKDGKYMIKTMTSAESKFLRRSKSNTDFNRYVVDFLLTTLFHSHPALFSTLCPKPKHHDYQIPRNVPC